MIAVPGLSGEAIVGALDERGIVTSTGSACHSGDPRPSAVLKAMGHDTKAGTVRFGLSKLTTDQEIDETVRRFADAVETLRQGD
jgi:cysteine desulfurase